MSIRLLFDPSLGISAEAFAAAWQQDPDTSRLAPVQTQPLASPGGPQSFGIPPEVTAAIVGILLGVPSNALWDAIKFTCQKITAPGELREIEYQHVKFPDGTEVTIIKRRQ